MFIQDLSLLSRSAVFDSLRPHGLWSTRLLCLWDFTGQNTGVGCHSLLQRIFLTQRSNLCLASPALTGGFFTTSYYHLGSHLFKMVVLKWMSLKSKSMSNSYIALKKANFQALHPLPVPWLKDGSFKYQLQHLWNEWSGKCNAISYLVFLVPIKKGIIMMLQMCWGD